MELVDVPCADCGATSRHSKRVLDTIATPRCKPCLKIERVRRSNARKNPDNTVKVNCCACGDEIERSRLRSLRVENHTCGSCWAEQRRAAARAKELTPTRIPRPPHALTLVTTSYAGRWKAQSDAARKRDSHTCQHCGITRQEYGRTLDVHHIRRFHDFASAAEANVLSNLITLCRSCHRLADCALRKADGTTVIRSPNRRPREYLKARFTCFGEFVCIFARNLKINSGDSRTVVEGESISVLMNLLATIIPRPTISRGLAYATDRCQVHTLTGLHAEIENECWQFLLAGATSYDTRSWAELFASGDHKLITSANRTYYLDWHDVDSDNYVEVRSYGQAPRRATKREWHVG